MKSVSSALNTHLQQGCTTLATCWRVTRLDGVQFHFTEHDRPLSINLGDGKGSRTYKADSSYNRSAVASNDQLSVDNLDLIGVLSSDEISTTDLKAGLFDYATVEIFLVNWDDLTQGILKMRKGRLGEVTITKRGYFKAELRGLAQAFSRRIGELISPECRADLGDSRCRVPIWPNPVRRGQAYAVGDFVKAASEMEGLVLLAHLDGDLTDDSPIQTAGALGGQADLPLDPGTLPGTRVLELSPSGSSNPSSAYAQFDDHASYALGAGAFTIDGHVRFKSLTTTEQVLASHWLTTGDQRGWSLSRDGGNLKFAYTLNGITVVSVTGAVTWAANTDYHIAVTRDASDDLRLFVDGVQVGITTASAGTIHNSSGSLFLGKLRDTVSGDLPLFGYLSDWRILVGTAAWVSGFTKPATLRIGQSDLTSEHFDDRVYICSTAGTTDPNQPAYDTILTNTTADGTAIFTAEEAWSRSCVVSAVGVNARKELTVTELTPNSSGPRGGFPNDWFNNGGLTFETGNNAGTTVEVKDFVADDGVTIEQSLVLWLETAFDIEVGDRLRVYPGCDKRITTCHNKFDNVPNFRGEPNVPGQDEVLAYPLK